MKNILIWLISLVLVSGCVRHTGNEAIGLQSAVSIADQLNARYQNTPINCGKNSMPAFLCSGVVLRATAPSVGFDFWNPSDGSVKSGGVSFSYLRADANFTTTVLGTSKGYIAYPVLEAPAGTENSFDYLCAFPIDGATNRRSDRGCGAHDYYPVDSRYCSVLGVTTAEQFYQHYMLVADPDRRKFHQCSFDVRDASNEWAGPAFFEMLRSMAKIPRMTLNDQNELIVRTWAQNIPNQLPIQALFYLAGNSTGLRTVQDDQRRFKTVTGKVLPIVSLKLPVNHQGTAFFAYNPADQAVQ